MPNKKSYPRSSRVAQLIQTAMARLLMDYLRDRAMAMVTVMGVEVSRNAGSATIYVSVLSQDEKEITATIAFLNKEKKTLRHELAQMVVMRHMPELYFRDDKTVREGRHLSDLLSDVVTDTDVHDNE